jgi:hypothetical protein
MFKIINYLPFLFWEVDTIRQAGQEIPITEPEAS